MLYNIYYIISDPIGLNNKSREIPVLHLFLYKLKYCSSSLLLLFPLMSPPPEATPLLASFGYYLLQQL